MQQLIQNIRSSIEVLLSIKNDPEGQDGDSSNQEIAEMDLCSPSSNLMKKDKRNKNRQRRTIQERKEAMYGKESIKSQSLFSNYYSGK